MAEKPQNNGDVGIIELLNYFKDGINSFFAGILSFFKQLYHLFIQLLLLIKNNIVYIVGVMVVFIALYFYINSSPSFKNYGYAMVVRPNYNSTEALYSQVNALTQMAQKSEFGPFADALQKIEIKPIANNASVVDAYYGALGNEFNTPSTFDSDFQRDTVFFREIPIREFEETMKPMDYQNFIIEIKTLKQWSADQIYDNVLKPIEEDPTYVSLRDNYLKDLAFQKESYIRSVKLIDTVLLSRTQPDAVASQEALNFANGSMKIMEEQLLKEKENALQELRLTMIQQAEYSNIIRVLSPAKPSEVNRRIKRSPQHFAWYGFLFALFTLLAKRFIKYLNRYSSQEA